LELPGIPKGATSRKGWEKRNHTKKYRNEKKKAVRRALERGKTEEGARPQNLVSFHSHRKEKEDSFIRKGK